MDAVQRHPDSAKPRLALARLYFRVEQAGKSEELLRDVVSLEPQSLAHRARLARFYVTEEKLDDAEKVLRDAARLDEDTVSATLLLVDFLRRHRSFEVAEDELSQRITAERMQYKYRFALAALYAEAERYEDARETLLDAVALDEERPERIEAKTRLASLAMQQDKQDETKTYLDEVLSESPGNVDALALRGTLALREQDYVVAIGDFRSVLRERPVDVRVIKALAQTHAAAGQQELAADMWRRLLDLAPQDHEARLILARTLAQMGEKEAALTELDRILAEAPDDAGAIETKLNLQATDNRWQEAEALAVRLTKVQPDSPVGYQKLGQVYGSQQRFNDAEKAFQDALARSDDDPTRVIRDLLKTYLAAGEHGKAEALLRKRIADEPDNARNHNFLGEVYLAQGQQEAGDKAFRAASAQDAAWDTPYINRARLRLMQKHKEGALAIYLEGVEKTGGSAQLAVLAAGMYEQTDRPEEAIALYEDVLQRFPRSDLVANNLAALLSENRVDPESIKRSLELAQRFAQSENALFLDTLGWAYYRSGDITQSVNALERAERFNPGIPIVRFHLGMARYKAGDVDVGREYLEKALSKGDDFPGAEEARAIIAQAD
jgi:tetratricopeptide (TPR) repeat protein